MSKHYQKSLKAEIYELYIKGISNKDLNNRYAIPISTLYSWITSWKRNALQTDTRREVVNMVHQSAILQKELEARRKELDIIHQSGILQSLPLDIRFQCGLPFFAQHPARLICSALEINQNTFNCKKRAMASQSLTATQQKYKIIRNEILEIYEQSRYRFGSEKIRICLKARGYSVGKKKIISIMKNLGIFKVHQIPLPYRSRSEHSI